jgi:tRNA nucleotidyltransferase/poly(A) polymerase
MTLHADAVDGLTEKGVSGTALDELCKLLMGRQVADALRDGRDTGVLAVLLPELAPVFSHDAESQYHDLTTDEHIFKTLERAAAFKCNLRTRMALLFHDSGKPEAGWYSQDGRLRYYEPSDEQWASSASNDGTREKPQDHAAIGARKARQVLTRLNAPRKLREDVATLCANHMVSVTGRTKPARVRQWRCQYGDDLLRDLLKLRLCDVMGKADLVDESAVAAIARLEKIRDEAEHEGVPTSPSDLAVGGKEAMSVGLQGPEIGRALRAVLHEVVSQPTKLHRSYSWQLGRLGALAAKEIRSR